MSEEKFYRCIPELNKECKKDNCYINGGECENTIYKKYALKGLLEEIERLNNIIEEYKNANEYHQNIIHELETMKRPNQLHSENVKLRAENNRLNNIINELEKDMNRDDLSYVETQYVLDKIKELKEEMNKE